MKYDFEELMKLENDELVAPLADTEAPVLPFLSNMYMQVPKFAVKVQLENLIATYGYDLIVDELLKKSK